MSLNQLILEPNYYEWKPIISKNGKKFIIANVKIINKPKYNYIELYEKLGSDNI
jgi:hypothetical protein